MDAVDEQLTKIIRRRGEIKEQFIQAWLAVNLPKDIAPESAKDFFINNVRLVERWSKDHLTVTWDLELKSVTEELTNATTN